MTEPYLATLNPEQRHAVEHNGDQPLLIIAGAGSGKTNTLAHRVAHLIVQRADPRRMMLLTFSRRAAAEMSRRVERIAAQVLPEHGRLMVDALTWSGTFHAIGARLLREYSDQIGLDRAFTIHDRGDSADLLNLTRHDLGLSNTERRFPANTRGLSMPKPPWLMCWLRISLVQGMGRRHRCTSEANVAVIAPRPKSHEG
jgi:DNA helicase II / ATP-dependent DNA helicase PcrA